MSESHALLSAKLILAILGMHMLGTYIGTYS